jgi:GTP-binding protein HflX
LVELGVESKPTMLVFNKMDRIQDPQVITELHQQYPEAIFISAEQKIGLKRLEEELVRLLNKEFIIKSLVLSHSDHKKVAWIHELADVLDKRYEDDGIHITFRVHQSSWKTLANKVLDVKKISEINA